MHIESWHLCQNGKNPGEFAKEILYCHIKKIFFQSCGVLLHCFMTFSWRTGILITEKEKIPLLSFLKILNYSFIYVSYVGWELEFGKAIPGLPCLLRQNYNIILTKALKLVVLFTQLTPYSTAVCLRWGFAGFIDVLLLVCIVLAHNASKGYLLVNDEKCYSTI